MPRLSDATLPAQAAPTQQRPTQQASAPTAAPREARVDGVAAPSDVAAAPPDATRLADGLAFKILTPGTGQRHPGTKDRVTVNYTGWTTDGKMFDSSVTRRSPATFPLSSVIPGWTEGVQQMTEGEHARFWIPESLAYKGNRSPARDARLRYRADQIHDSPPPTSSASPADIARVPPDATYLADGLAFKVLKPGSGQRRPTGTDRVTVDYTGWTADGKVFDSSAARGAPATFPLNAVIPGWREGVEQMTEGELARRGFPRTSRTRA